MSNDEALLKDDDSEGFNKRVEKTVRPAYSKETGQERGFGFVKVTAEEIANDTEIIEGLTGEEKSKLLEEVTNRGSVDLYVNGRSIETASGESLSGLSGLRVVLRSIKYNSRENKFFAGKVVTTGKFVEESEKQEILKREFEVGKRRHDELLAKLNIVYNSHPYNSEELDRPYFDLEDVTSVEIPPEEAIVIVGEWSSPGGGSEDTHNPMGRTRYLKQYSGSHGAYSMVVPKSFLEDEDFIRSLSSHKPEGREGHTSFKTLDGDSGSVYRFKDRKVRIDVYCNGEQSDRELLLSEGSDIVGGEGKITIYELDPSEKPITTKAFFSQEQVAKVWDKYSIWWRTDLYRLKKIYEVAQGLKEVRVAWGEHFPDVPFGEVDLAVAKYELGYLQKYYKSSATNELRHRIEMFGHGVPWTLPKILEAESWDRLMQIRIQRLTEAVLSGDLKAGEILSVESRGWLLDDISNTFPVKIEDMDAFGYDSELIKIPDSESIPIYVAKIKDATGNYLKVPGGEEDMEVAISEAWRSRRDPSLYYYRIVPDDVKSPEIYIPGTLEWVRDEDITSSDLYGGR